MLVGPAEESGHGQVIHPGPHVTGGCKGPKKKTTSQIPSSESSAVRRAFRFRTHVQVALQPALLRHRHDGHQVAPQAPAGFPSVMPRLFLLERFVAEVPKLVPVWSRAPQLWRRAVTARETSARARSHQRDRESRSTHPRRQRCKTRRSLHRTCVKTTLSQLPGEDAGRESATYCREVMPFLVEPV